jgi:WhiB family transcriptional regulator, redox-sensing transcriptional regulator
MQWLDATVGEIGTTGFEASGSGTGWPRPDVRQIGAGYRHQAGQREFDLPCTEDPELFFAESPEEVEQAKAMCRGCKARLACLAGALARREPCGVWGGELLMRGAIVPRKRPRGRPRKTEVAA